MRSSSVEWFYFVFVPCTIVFYFLCDIAIYHVVGETTYVDSNINIAHPVINRSGLPYDTVNVSQKGFQFFVNQKNGTALKTSTSNTSPHKSVHWHTHRNNDDVIKYIKQAPSLSKINRTETNQLPLHEISEFQDFHITWGEKRVVWLPNSYSYSSSTSSCRLLMIKCPTDSSKRFGGFGSRIRRGTFSVVVIANCKGIIHEVDFATCDTFNGTTMNFVMVYLLTPTLAKNSVAEDASTKAVTELSAYLPANVYERGNYSFTLRMTWFRHKHALFSVSGFTTSIIGTSTRCRLVVVQQRSSVLATTKRNSLQKYGQEEQQQHHKQQQQQQHSLKVPNNVSDDDSSILDLLGGLHVSFIVPVLSSGRCSRACLVPACDGFQCRVC